MDIKKTTQLAIKYLQDGNLKFAEHLFRDILEVQPHNISALHFIGVIHYELKDYDSAIKYIRKAIQFGPNYVDAYNNLGLVLEETNRRDEAIMCYEKAVALNPNFDRAHYNLATALKEKWRIDESIKHYRIAIQLNPRFVEAYNNMGLALQDQGNLEEAERYFRLALKMKPDFSLCYSNLLLLMNYSSRYDPPTVFSEHLRFANQIVEPLSSALLPHANDPSSARRLRIGYVSPDFRKHSVAYFIEPVLKAHSSDHFEVFCYSDVLRPDNTTKRLQECADQWRSIAGMSDAEAAELIRRDEIDILVDLAGHTGNNRMLVFARKPAPVQVSWLGYPNTTGISTVDYRFVDGYTDPPGLTDPFYTEELIRLPESFLCYLPDKDSPSVEESPFIKSGHITFGSFNYFTKVSPETMALWTAIMKAVPNSYLILKSRNFSDRTTRNHAMKLFTRNDISADRLELLPIKLSFAEHLGMYNRVDIGLDTFPYNGTATTCEALWMGVPVITLAGNTHASRVGLSILSNIGLRDLVAQEIKEYIEIAVDMATSTSRLKFLRETLREKMVHSALCNAKRFTRNLEDCYRLIWLRYTGRSSSY